MPELTIFDQIGLDPETGAGLTAKSFDTQLKALGNPSQILLRINSPGGAVMDGMAIYTMLKTSRAKVTARIEGIAASAASLVAMAADRIEIAENAFILIHQPHTVAQGSAEDLSSAAGDLQLLSNQYASIYAARSGQPVNAVRSLMDEDRLMSAEEAVELGYADAIVDNDTPVNMRGLAPRYLAKIESEKQRRREIAELGKIAGRPRLAARLMKEGVSTHTAFRRIRASQKRRDAARKVEIETGWTNAVAALRGEPKAAGPDPHNWAAAIKRAFPNG